MKVLRHDHTMQVSTDPSRADRPWAVLLAAGSASRMGLRPKCLLERDGVPLVVRLLRELHAAGVGQVVLVLGHYAEAIDAAVGSVADLPALEVRRVLNTDPAAGQDASLRLGLQAVPASAGTVLVLLADQPLLASSDVRDLLGVWQRRPAGIGFLQPVHAGSPGHPVVLSAEAVRSLRDQPAGQGGRQWRAAHADRVLRWPVDHARFTTDVDRPDDVLRLVQAGIDLRWPGDPA
jgi:CTP:molybdopterin cytidylyltransferase MocA